MGRQRKVDRLPPFVATPWAMLNDKAFCSLSHSARACLPYWLGKPKARFDSLEYFEKEFVFPYPEAQRYGFAKATFAKIIRELVGKGFVDPKDKGGLKSDGLSYNRFVLSKRWMKYGSSEFVAISWQEFKPRLKKSKFRK